MFRDFDGNEAVFGDKAIPATSSNDALVTAYLSADSNRSGRYVIVALNRSTSYQDVAFTGLPSVTGTAKVYRLDGNPADPASPAPPRSWIPTTRRASRSSRQASINRFSS